MEDQDHPVLTKEKLLEVVQQVEGTKDVVIAECVRSPGTKPGDNYGSELVKCDLVARVGGKEKTFHWMVKLQLLDTSFAEVHLEEKEIFCYDYALKKWNSIAEEKEASFRLNSIKAPYTELHREKDKRSILVMENMKHLGYEDALDKKKGLSLSHAKLVLEEIARFHALGYVWVKNHPEGIEGGRAANKIFLTDYIYAEPPQDVYNMMKSTTDKFLATIKLVQEPGQNLDEIYEKFTSTVDPFAHFTKLSATNNDLFNVVCHGDLWFNNTLFKHDENGAPVKVSLLDLSGTKWASPCCDLAYFLYSSTTPMLRETHLEEMLGYYHDTFVHCLWQLGEDPSVYSFRQLLKDFNKHAFIGFWIAFYALPFFLAKEDDVIGQEAFAAEMSDPDKMDEMTEMLQRRYEQAVANEPQLKIMLGGVLLDMVKRNIF